MASNYVDVIPTILYLEKEHDLFPANVPTFRGLSKSGLIFLRIIRKEGSEMAPLLSAKSFYGEDISNLENYSNSL